MYLSWPVIVFYYLFDILLLLLFLFAESYLGIYVIGGFGLLFLAYSSKLDFSKIKQFKLEIVLSWLFFCALFVVSVFTHAPALSLNSLIFFGFALTFFNFFLLLDKKYVQPTLFFTNILIVVFSVSVLSLFFTVLPQIAESLPEMNLIHATYGHNHFSSIAVMMLPLTWYFIFLYKKDSKKQLPFLALLVLLMVNLSLSFGRVAMMVGLLQFVFFAGQYFFTKRKMGGLAKAMILSLSSLAIFAFILVNYYSLAKLLGLNAICPWPEFKNQICKDVKNDQRFEYFKTAIISTKENFLVGYGPGSYALISEKYKNRPDVSTSFAHNFILQISAESGVVVASLFTIFIFVLLFKTFRITFIRLKEDVDPNINVFLFMGASSLLIISLLDFDLSYLSLISLALLFFGQILVSKSSPINEKNENKIAKLLFNFLNIIFVLLAILSLIVECFLMTGQTNRAATLFPYFQSHMKIFLDDTKHLDQNSRKKLAYIYRNYLYLYMHADEVGGFIKNRDKVLDISPWSAYSPTLLRNVAEIDIEMAAFEVKNLFTKYEKLDEAGFKSLPNTDYEIAAFSLSLADKYLSEGKVSESAGFYKMAHLFYKWIFVESFPRFLYQFENDEQKMSFWSEMTEIEGQYFAKHTGQVAIDHRPLLIAALKKNDLNMAKKWFARIMDLDSGLLADMEYLELPQAQKMADYFIELEDWENAELAVKLVYEIGSNEGRAQLGNYYLMRGEFEKAKLAYQACLDGWRDEIHAQCDLRLKSSFDQTKEPYLLASQKIRAKN